MTVKEARKILGIEAKHLSDKQIMREIYMASFLAEIVINEYLKSERQVK